ncbi:MAG: winged helix-turn-helix transcriptional regulator, partial [Candidatus Thorarchaeota archaeon]|nr:winged helix-turn-helix transcriptional regulator [Candidatus Thorarchaeota archaeon]
MRESEGCIASGDAVEIKLDDNPQPIEFDEKDIILASELKVESKGTLRELGDIIDLSETQVKRRLDRLEEAGIIKGYRWILKKIEQPLYIYFFVELSENIDCVLSAFYRLPFPSEIMMDSRTKYCIRIRIHGTEMTGLLRGMTQMRKYMDSYFVQIAYDIASVPSNYPGEFFDKKT